MPQTIKLKRSSTAGQAPTTAQLDLGELAINTSDGKIYLRKSDGQGEVIIEIGGALVNSAATVTSSATAPTNPTPTSGNLWYDTINDVLMMYDGTNWKEVAHELSALQVTGNTTLGDNGATDTLTVNADATFNDDVSINGITAGEVVYANAAADLDGSANFTYDGTTLDFNGTLDVDGSTTLDNISFDGNTIGTTTGNLTIDTAGTLEVLDVTNFNTHVTVDGNTTLGNSAPNDTLTVNAVATFTGTDGMVIPSGTTGQRVTASTGTIRYNTTTSSFEGYSGTSWGSLGGVKDVDQDTYITTEASAGSDEDTFTFYAANNVNATWTSSLLDINTAVNIDGVLTTTNTGTFGNAAADTQTFNGNVDMNNTLNVDGATTLNGTVDLGNATSDTITATGRFDSHLVPNVNKTRDLGTTSLRWDDIYADSIDLDSHLVVDGNTTLGNAASDSLTVNAAADFNATVNIDGALTTAANSRFGDGAGDTHTFNGQVDLNNDLEVDGTTILNGALTTRGNSTIGNAASDTHTFNGNVDMNNNLNVDGALTTTGTGTFGNAASDTQTFNGAVDMNSNLNVDGNTTVNNLEVGDGNNFTFGSGANRVTFTDTTRMTVSNEAGTIIFDGRIFVP